MPYATIAANPTIRMDRIRMGPRRREPCGGGGIISGSRLEGGRGLIPAKASPGGGADVVVGLLAARCGDLKFAAGGSFGNGAEGCACARRVACALAARRRSMSSWRTCSLICPDDWDVRYDFPPSGSSGRTHYAPPELYLTIDLMPCPVSSPINDCRPHRHDCIRWRWAVKYQLNRS